MGFWNKRIKDTKAIAKDIGVEETKIKELKQGKREIGGNTMGKVLTSIEKTKESKLQKKIRQEEILDWYKRTDLAQLRQQFGFKKQKQLAKEIGMSPSTLCQLELKTKTSYSKSMEMLYDFYKDDFNKNIKEEDEQKETVEQEKLAEKEETKEEEIKIEEKGTPVEEEKEEKVGEKETRKDSSKEKEEEFNPKDLSEEDCEDISILVLTLTIERQNKEIEKLERQIKLYEKLIEKL
jgi:transcriptional regulator with XRE-family HTH domain